MLPEERGTHSWFSRDRSPRIRRRPRSRRIQHFTSHDGTRYAASVRGERNLKLSVFEVFRCYATELQDTGLAHSPWKPGVSHVAL